MIDPELILEECRRLHAWAAAREYRAISINTVPRPGWVDWLRHRSRSFGVAWRQLFRLSPLDLRRLFPNPVPAASPKALVLFAMAYGELSFGAGRAEYGPHFVGLLERVLALRSPRSAHFAVSQKNRLYLKAYTAGEDDVAPLLTAWAGRLFLSAFYRTGEDRHLAQAREIAAYFLTEHPREARPGGTYFYYSPSLADEILNASAEISSFLVCYGAAAGDGAAMEVGWSGLNYVGARQNDDGSWFYGPAPRFRYIDNFHTAFVLRALAAALSHGPAPGIASALDRGLGYYRRRLFEEAEDGLRPVHLDRRYLPLNSNLFVSVDLRDVTAAAVLFLDLARRDPRWAGDAERLLRWALRHLRTPQGTYCPEVTPWWTNRIPYVDFQAWMLYCLAKYSAANQNSSAAAA